MDRKDLVKFNLNCHVYVSLNDGGIVAFLEHVNRFVEFSGQIKAYTTRELTERYLDVDTGLWKMQMHEFMDAFGSMVMHKTHFGLEVYFDPSELVMPEAADNISDRGSVATGGRNDRPVQSKGIMHDGRGPQVLDLSENLRNRMNSNVEEMHCRTCDAVTGHTTDGVRYTCCICDTNKR